MLVQLLHHYQVMWPWGQREGNYQQLLQQSRRHNSMRENILKYSEEEKQWLTPDYTHSHTNKASFFMNKYMPDIWISLRLSMHVWKTYLCPIQQAKQPDWLTVNTDDHSF